MSSTPSRPQARAAGRRHGALGLLGRIGLRRQTTTTTRPGDPSTASSPPALAPLLPSDQQALVGAFPSPVVVSRPSGSRAGRLVTGQDLTVAEVADLFHVSEQTAKRWASDKKVPSQLVKGRRRYPAAAVAELAQDRNIPLPDWLCAASAQGTRPHADPSMRRPWTAQGRHPSCCDANRRVTGAFFP